MQEDRGKGKGREGKPKWTASVLQSGPVGERGGVWRLLTSAQGSGSQRRDIQQTSRNDPMYDP
ncbi:hypothetical protein IFM47457_06546 [Aspergillus lentulus]|nr:hypothetical protein IFM47457_06546 [Aspergillus lentulus]